MLSTVDSYFTRLIIRPDSDLVKNLNKSINNHTKNQQDITNKININKTSRNHNWK